MDVYAWLRVSEELDFCDAGQKRFFKVYLPAPQLGVSVGERQPEIALSIMVAPVASKGT